MAKQETLPIVPKLITPLILPILISMQAYKDFDISCSSSHHKVELIKYLPIGFGSFNGNRKYRMHTGKQSETVRLLPISNFAK
jgi:hypothetical protein